MTEIEKLKEAIEFCTTRLKQPILQREGESLQVLLSLAERYVAVASLRVRQPKRRR